MSGFYDDNNEEKNAYKKMVVLCIAASSIVVLLFLTVLYMNSSDKRKRLLQEKAETQQAIAEAEASKMKEMSELNLGENSIVSSDLDFWNMYDEADSIKKKSTVTEPVETVDKTQEINEFIDPNEKNKENGDSGNLDENADGEVARDEAGPLENPNSEEKDTNKYDGSHIAIPDGNGKTKWYEISEIVDKNKYDFDKFLSKDGSKYTYRSGQITSSFGIDVSKHQGSIDWGLVKNSGVDFVMLRAAARGYESGVLGLDERFAVNMDGITKNAIPFGVYVYSQAINENEAIEEANYAVVAVMNYGISYPIAIDVESVEGEIARTDNLSVAERTKCVKAFCDTVKNYGFKPIIYADRDFIIRMLDIETLKDYDFWVRDTNGQKKTDSGVTYTDYPYHFSMWQYSDSGSINGISGPVDLNISFINSSDR